jgi:hypothetical protein
MMNLHEYNDELNKVLGWAPKQKLESWIESALRMETL